MMTFTRKGHTSHHYDLENGSALLMKAPTNEYWRHEIRKEVSSQPRISVSFHQL